MEDKKVEYYKEKVEDLYSRFVTGEKGLKEEEAEKRLQKYGENKLTEQKKKSDIVLFFNQFRRGFYISICVFGNSFY